MEKRIGSAPFSSGSQQHAINCCVRRGGPSIKGEKNQAIGRSRGGRTTKIHALTDTLCRPIAFLLTGGHVADCTAGAALIERLPDCDVVHADKGYNSNAIRSQVRDRGAWANIPPKANRKWKNVFSPFLYRGRNAIERMFCRLKDFQTRRHTIRPKRLKFPRSRLYRSNRQLLVISPKPGGWPSSGTIVRESTHSLGRSFSTQIRVLWPVSASDKVLSDNFSDGLRRDTRARVGSRQHYGRQRLAISLRRRRLRRTRVPSAKHLCGLY